MLQDKIEKDFIGALKEKNEIKISVLRLVKADIKNYMIEKLLKELKDDDIYIILQRQIKRHEESIEQFAKGQREDLVEKETKELEIIKAYMPKGLSEAELKAVITATISELQAVGKKDFGKVIKAVMEKTKGRADGKTVSSLVNELLK